LSRSGHAPLLPASDDVRRRGGAAHPDPRRLWRRQQQLEWVVDAIDGDGRRGRPTIGVASTGVGDVLVDSHNRTVYLFNKDTGTKSTCYGACAAKWPPVRATGKPTVGGGAKAAMLGTTSRSDGKPQLTYRGHPLYLFVGDNTPAAANGQGVKAFGGAWFVVSPAGNQVSGKSTAGRSNGY